MLSFLGPLLQAGASIFGGIMGQQNNQANINATNFQNALNFQRQVDLTNMSNAEAEKMTQIGFDESEKFAQMGTQWKVDDVDKAAAASGINRLTLLGVPGFTAPGVSVGSTASPINAPAPESKNVWGPAMSDVGQNISRAVTAMAPESVRAAQLENDLKEAQIANLNSDTTRKLAAAADSAVRSSPGTGPGFTVPLPPEDPRGPVIPLVQRAWDYRTNEIVNIPSEKAASPLQTLGAAGVNAALAGRGFSEGLIGYPGGSDNWVPFARPDLTRWQTPAYEVYSPY